MPENHEDVITILEHDHREIERMFDELEALRGTADGDVAARRTDLVEQVTIELVRHSVAEEMLVYPQVEKKVSADQAERARHEHAVAEETMQRLERLDPGDPAFDRELDTLMREVRHHIAEEESEMFAHMRQVLGQDELERMGSRVRAFKDVAPTRPHPSVPNEPGVRATLGPVTGLLDRMRDTITGRGT